MSYPNGLSCIDYNCTVLLLISLTRSLSLSPSISMVKAVKGVLLECDSTVKQIVLNLNKRGNFVIEDLDDTHLFIEASWVEQLKYELDKILDENSYTVTTTDDKDNKKI